MRESDIREAENYARQHISQVKQISPSSIELGLLWYVPDGSNWLAYFSTNLRDGYRYLVEYTAHNDLMSVTEIYDGPID